VTENDFGLWLILATLNLGTIGMSSVKYRSCRVNVSGLATSTVDRRVTPKTIKLVFATYQLGITETGQCVSVE
jgi:hypothetical protein